jgi:transketolase N-terminal domain/subunit
MKRLLKDNINTEKYRNKMISLEKRIIDISYKYNLSHLSSNLTAVRIIDTIYELMKKDDIFVLSQGHAGIALYVVLEKYGMGNAENRYTKHGWHSTKDKHIYCSTGSLGCGLSIALGSAIAKPLRDVYCLISDGECAEGIVWESLQIADDYDVYNLHTYVNFNGYSGYEVVDKNVLKKRLSPYKNITIIDTQYIYKKFDLHGIVAHYKSLTKEQYEKLLF